MTPENDVNKDTEKNGGEKPLNGDSASTTNTDANNIIGAASDQLSAKANAASTKSVDDSTDAPIEADAVVSSIDQDDIDRAASAQTHADEAIAKAMAGGDDPLGFGDQRMEGDAATGDAVGGESEASEPGADDPAMGGDEVSVLRAQLGESESKVANHADQLLRLQAEMENQRKRAQNDVTKAHKFALEKIAIDLLPVKDSLEMGLLAATGADADPIKIIEGSELTLKMLAQALEKYNIVEVNPIDEKFDPEFHQAMSMQPVEGKEPNTVAGVMQKGYTLNDRLIRPALVMVAK